MDSNRARLAGYMQGGSSPVVWLRPVSLLMAEEPTMRVCGVDHVEVTPDERTVWRCERDLRILALCVNVSMSMTVASVELVVGAGDGEPDEREQGKEHDRGASAGNDMISISGNRVRACERRSLCAQRPLPTCYMVCSASRDKDSLQDDSTPLILRNVRCRCRLLTCEQISISKSQWAAFPPTIF